MQYANLQCRPDSTWMIWPNDMGRVLRGVAIVVMAVGFWFWSADLQQESQDIFYTVMDACELYWGLHLEEGRAEEMVASYIEQYDDAADHMCWILLEGHETGKHMGMTKWEMWLAHTSVWRRGLILVLSCVLFMVTPLWYVSRTDSDVMTRNRIGS